MGHVFGLTMDQYADAWPDMLSNGGEEVTSRPSRKVVQNR